MVIIIILRGLGTIEEGLKVFVKWERVFWPKSAVPLTAAAAPTSWFWSFGGSVDDFSGSTAVKYINPAAASPAWVAGPSLSVSRGAGGSGMYSGVANSFGSSIYLYGGSDSAYYFLAVMVKLNVSNLAGGWSNVAVGGTPLVKYNSVSATINGIFYYVGGFDSNSGNAFQKDTSSYNPATNTMTNVVTGATLPSGVGDTTVTNRGCLVALGGSLYYMRNSYLLKWTPGDSSWTSITTGGTWQNSGTPSCAVYDGKAVQMAGTTSTIYDPATGTFAALPGTAATRNHKYPVAQSCANKIVAPAVSQNPIQVDSYDGTAFSALPNYVENQASQYMTTVVNDVNPQ